ncbi:ATP-grasp domain-containing protein [Paraburkholderia sediminicola]|uniref:ATP-grasp domain-containing protein n=1 Tax=Paraburkholderia sediminicola TaxID=458836 RepID=UPI0038B89692
MHKSISKPVLQQLISNKNEFQKICESLDIPTLVGYSFDDIDDFFREIGPCLDSEKSYLLKSANDRVILEDKRRRFFLSRGGKDFNDYIVSECARIGEGASGFQIQEYHDFRTIPVTYYNTAFKLSSDVVEHLTTVQLVNFSAIERNIPSTHWGNMKEIPHPLLNDAKEHARRLVRHYRDMGYVGEIGVDFGLTDSGIFFLETNARLNNSTRLFYYLLALGIDPVEGNYIYISNFIVDFLHYRLLRFRKMDGVSFESLPDAKTLIVTQTVASLREIYGLIETIGQSEFPIPG